MDQAWSKWEEQFISLMCQCITTMSVKLKKSPLWLTPDLTYLERFPINEHGKSDHLDCYEKNKTANMLKPAKSKFLNQLDPSTLKTFWKIAKYFTKQKCSIPTLIEECRWTNHFGQCRKANLVE